MAIVVENNQVMEWSADKTQYYSWGERLYRLPVFRFGVKNEGLFEEAIIRCYDLFSKCELFPEKFDEARAERSLQVFKGLGAQEFFVTPRDGRALVHMIILRAQDFERILDSYGAQWKEMQIENGEEILAIVPPSMPDGSWRNFEEDCLLKMGWEKRIIIDAEGISGEVIVTCENAEYIDRSQYHTQCFLHCHSTSGPFIRERGRVGVYLGMKQDLCFFDHRGIWKSKGVPSEAGFYLDVACVYDKLMEECAYDPKCVWASGFCGGGAVAAYLKALHHNEGINCIEEQSFIDLYRDFVDTQSFPARLFAHYENEALLTRDIDPEIKPDETGFNVEELWRNLAFYESPIGGKVILIHARNDERLNDMVKLRYVECAQQVNAFVYQVHFTSTAESPHADDFFHYKEAKKDFLKMVFSH